MDGSGQIHDLVTLLRGKTPPVPRQEAGVRPGDGLDQMAKTNPFPCREYNLDRLVRS
jgi:hypothetical protein